VGAGKSRERLWRGEKQSEKVGRKIKEKERLKYLPPPHICVSAKKTWRFDGELWWLVVRASIFFQTTDHGIPSSSFRNKSGRTTNRGPSFVFSSPLILHLAQHTRRLTTIQDDRERRLSCVFVTEMESELSDIRIR
jgi:hypothetical protein